MKQAIEIAQLGAPVLRQTAEPVRQINSSETRQVIEIMHDTLANTLGVGLAAPQISILNRIIIVASRPTNRYPHAPIMPPTVMINPKYEPVSDIKVKDWEGCLSIPGVRALVPRYQAIDVQYTDINGNPVEQRLEDFVARVFQHEVDHLDGKVYLDRVESTLEIIAESEYLKRFTSTQVL